MSDDHALPVTHAAHARTAWAAAVVLAVWTGLVALWLLLDAAAWIVLGLMLFTVPAALDFARGRRAWLRLDHHALAWGSGRQGGEIALRRIDRVRFETRLDLSVRVRVVLDTGQRVILPQDSLPPPQQLQAGLDAAGIRTERHHFSLL